MTQPYGDAVIVSHYDRLTARTTITVDRADNRIGVHRELWNEASPDHRIDDQTLVLDTAGQYRYRLVEDNGGDTLIFERIRDDEQSSGGER